MLCSLLNRSTVYRFPLKNNELTLKWLNTVQRKNFVPNELTKICSLHFRAEDNTISLVNEQPVLKKDAVSSVFDYLEHLLSKKSCRRILERSPVSTNGFTGK